MTCIVGLVDNGNVWIGADSVGVGGFDATDRVDEKVFVRDGLDRMIMGFTWSFRMGQLLRYKLKIPERPVNMPVPEYMMTHFVDAVRDCLKAGGFAQKNLEVEQGGVFLVGYAGRLFQMEQDYQVGERRDGFDACGCGANYALGSLFSTDPKSHPRWRVRRALEAAERFSAGVRRPFKIQELKA